MDRVFLLPRRGLHLVEGRADDDLDVVAAEAFGAAAAVHRGIAAAEHDHAFADRRDVAERHRGEPVDADVDVRRGFTAAGDRQVATARSTGADEDGIPVLRQKQAHGVDAGAAAELDTELQHVAGFLVDDLFGKPKARDLRTDHAAGLGVAVEHDDLVAQRRQVTGDGERGRAAADAGDPLAVALRWPRQVLGDVVLEVGRDSLQAADRDRFRFGGLGLFDPPAPTSRLAWAVTGTPQDARKDVRFPVDEIRVGIATGRDQADVFRDGRVGGASPLAIDDFVEVVRIADDGGSQISLSHAPTESGRVHCNGAKPTSRS